MPKNSEPASSGDTLGWANQAGDKAPRDLTGVTLGDFQVNRLLGRGGMGEVYLARQASLNREVALKVLRPDLLKNPTYSARFESEAWAAAKLNDPNVVHIYSLGTIDGVQYIAMEYIQGTNLREYLQKKGPPELLLALSIMRQSGNAIKAAGEMGLVHRDIKPENLMLTRKGLVKVADFGLCRDQDSERPHVTQPGVTMGTPLYMSPEQAQGHALDHRSDLYSLGVTFYHMLAGQPPFKGETPLALALKHVKDAPVDLAVHRPDLPPDLCQLVMKLMAKAPAQRYQSASEMLRDLAKVREAAAAANASAPTNAGTPALTGTSPAVASSVSTAPVRTVIDRVAPTRRDLRLGSPLLAALMFAGLIVGAVTGWMLRPPNLLAATAKGPTTAPALWMAPEWVEVPKQESAEQQYRYAQLKSNPVNREAVWLAVPGYYPQARDWASRAYTQLARVLFHDRHPRRLKVFAGELAKTERAHEKRLAQIVNVSVGVLEGDPEGVINVFGQAGDYIGTLTDPALAELSLEITLAAHRVAQREAMTASTVGKLREIENRLIQKTVVIMFQDILGRPIAP